MFEGASPLSVGRNPIPFIPFLLSRGRGVSRKRGFAPLRHPDLIREDNMKNRLISITLIVLSLFLVSSLMGCGTPSIVGRWQYTGESDWYIEFLNDGRAILDIDNFVFTGTYELVGENYIKMDFEGLAGAVLNLSSMDTQRFEISGDILKLGNDTTLKRVRQ